MKIKSIKKCEQLEMTYDLEVEDTHTYQLDNGMVSHNTTSQKVNCSSGIHPRFSQYYIRTVRADGKDPLAKMLIEKGFPHEVDCMSPSNYVFSFPVKSPDDSIFRNDYNAMQQLELWKRIKENWAEHTVSITVYVKEHEWLEVGAWVYKNFDKVTGISFLPHSDHIYKQAPYQEINKEEYERALEKMPKYIDWNELSKYENEDMTTNMKEYACSAGHCEI